MDCMRARITVAAAGLLGALLVLELALSVMMVAAQAELMFGEALVYGHARRLLEGVGLYQPVDRFPYSVTTYTPLAYVPLALLQVVGQGFGAGRALALLSVLASGGLVGVLA